MSESTCSARVNRQNLRLVKKVIKSVIYFCFWAPLFGIVAKRVLSVCGPSVVKYRGVLALEAANRRPQAASSRTRISKLGSAAEIPGYGRGSASQDT